jgi:hypothetical protein
MLFMPRGLLPSLRAGATATARRLRTTY